MGAEASGLAMGNANLLLFLLLPVTFCQAGELKLMSLVGNERYMQDNDLTSLNETSCTGIEFHDYEDYADYCDPKYDGEECEDDPQCHFSKLNVTLDEEGRYPDVENCCPFLGFIERFGHWFEGCGDCKNTSVINAELIEEWASMQKGDRLGPQVTEDGPRSSISNTVPVNAIPNCCGPDGILNKKTLQCNTEINASVNKTLRSCTLELKKSIEVTTNISDPRIVCVSRLNSNEGGGLVCRHHCHGREGCLQACMGRNDATDFQTNELVGLQEGFNLTEVLGVSSDGIVYGEAQQ